MFMTYQASKRPSLTLLHLRLHWYFMALSGYSPSPSPRSISPAFTDSSGQDSTPSDHEYVLEAGSDQPGSPNSGDKDKSAKNAEPDAVTCLWDDCGVIFTHLPTLITHIHDGESQPPVSATHRFYLSCCLNRPHRCQQIELHL